MPLFKDVSGNEIINLTNREIDLIKKIRKVKKGNYNNFVFENHKYYSALIKRKVNNIKAAFYINI
jgi:hypothetical protein